MDYNYRFEDMLAVDPEILNIREAPDPEYVLVGVLERHVILKVIAIYGEWYK